MSDALVMRGSAERSAASPALAVPGWIGALASAPVAGADAALIDEIEMLERLKSAAAARQARLTAVFAASQRAARRAAGVREEQISRGIGAQVALARHDSPHAGNRHLGLAEALTCEMPCTLAALQAGETSEYRATLLVRESACLSREHRAALDAEVGPRLAVMGNGRTEREARGVAYRLDPSSALRRIRGAEADRCVSVRPAPEVMARLSALLPVASGVAAYASLRRHADRLTADGDPRGYGQIMADTLVQRVTGQEQADPADAEILLIVPESTLTAPPTRPAGGDGPPAEADPAPDPAHEPARLPEYGPVPAWWARRLIRDSSGRVWLRRAFARDARLVGLESTRRLFPAGLRRALVVRDDTCRTPWCDAPIRHADHVEPHGEGYPTSLDNGQGLCAACNYAKQAPGWRASPVPGADVHTVRVTTPTGRTYESQAPPLPGTRRKPDSAGTDLPAAG